jgi:integrase
VSLRNELTRIKGVFRYAVEARLLDSLPKFGPAFKSPSHKSIRQSRNEKGPLLFSAEELHRILENANPILKAMILLGISGGFGNTDVAGLPISAISEDSCWINYPRPKTGVSRRIPLWPETKQAIRSCLSDRPAPKDAKYDRLVFLTRSGRPWVRVGKLGTEGAGISDGKLSVVDLIGQAFRRLLAGLEIEHSGASFYSLRRTFQTIGEESRDFMAVGAIMGHVPHINDMSAVYRQLISDDRLMEVSRTVRHWLWPDAV